MGAAGSVLDPDNVQEVVSIYTCMYLLQIIMQAVISMDII